jgi:hypothetical protein
VELNAQDGSPMTPPTDDAFEAFGRQLAAVRATRGASGAVLGVLAVAAAAGAVALVSDGRRPAPQARPVPTAVGVSHPAATSALRHAPPE